MDFFIDLLDLGFDDFLMISIRKLELVFGAVIWHVLDEADFAVVDATLHEIEIVDSPSWLVVWEFCGKQLEVGLTVLIVLSRALSGLDKLATRIATFWNSENSPSEFALSK